MKINTLAGLFAALLIVVTSACNKSFKTTDEGLKYMYLVESDTSEVAGEGGYIKFHFVIKSATDSLINSTYENGAMPTEMLVPPPTYEGCLFGGLALLKGGDSVQFKVVADSFFSKTARGTMPPFVKAGEELTITVAVVASKSKETFDKEQAAKKQKEIEEAQKVLVAETKQLEEAAKMLGVGDKLQRTPSGLMYVKMKETTGKTAVNGDVAGFFYRGTFLDGKEFDSNIGKEPFTVSVGQGGAIAGWMEVVDKIKVGEKWMLFVPSSLAYGKEGAGPIGPNTPLIFEMELNSIKTAEQIQKEREEKEKKLKAEEGQKISSFLKKKNYKNLQKLTIGEGTVHYVIENAGMGGLPMEGNTISVKVRAFDLDGKAIPDLTMEQPPVNGPLSKNMLPPAMYEVMLKMKKGGTARFVCASELFQGSQGGGAIAPFTPVMVELELLDISKEAPKGAAPQHGN